MPRFSAILFTFYFLLFTFAPPAFGVNLLQVSDVLSNPKTSTTTKHTVSFVTDSAVSNGFFRFLISNSFTLNSPVSITATNLTGYTFATGVATSSGNPNCTSPTNYHCLEIHYSGSGAIGATITITINSGTLTNPATENVFPFQLRHYNNLGTLISQTTGKISIHNNPTVTTKVLDYAVSNPILISPNDFAITNNPYEPFSFTRSTSIPGVDYYDLYLDDQLVAGNIDHDLLTQEYYFFKTLRQDETIHILLKQPLSEGTHTWYVKAYGVSGSRKSATSGKRSFTVDSTFPQIILTSIDNQILNWIVPDKEDIIVRSNNPFFKGKVEALSNLKLSLLCPPLSSYSTLTLPYLRGGKWFSPSKVEGDQGGVFGGTTCSDQSITIYEEDGNWEHRFHNLIPNHRYEVYIAATDKAGNSHVFPKFFITYVPFNIISYIFPTPTPSLPPSTLEGGVPSSKVEEGQGGVSEVKVPPPSPTVYPSPIRSPGEGGPRYSLYFLLYPLLLLGLLLHISLTLFGASVPLRQILPFLWRLLFPFIVIARSVLTTKQSSIQMDRHANTLAMTKTKPLSFTTISIFNPSDLLKKPYLYTSNILGHFGLPDNLSSQILLRLTRPGYFFKDQLIAHQTLIAISELNLERKNSPSALERLQLTALAIRWLPLLVADITGLLYLSVTVSPSALVYTLIAIQLTYSEYIYPIDKS